MSSQDYIDDTLHINAEPQTNQGPWILDEYETIKICRYNKDTNKWMARAKQAKVGFYQDAQSGEIRIICYNNKNELRLSHLPDKEIGHMGRKEGFSDKDVLWIGIDKTINPEKDNHAYQFLARFNHVKTADEFMQLYECAAESNLQLK